MSAESWAGDAWNALENLRHLWERTDDAWQYETLIQEYEEAPWGLVQANCAQARAEPGGPRVSAENATRGNRRALPCEGCGTDVTFLSPTTDAAKAWAGGILAAWCPECWARRRREVTAMTAEEFVQLMHQMGEMEPSAGGVVLTAVLPFEVVDDVAALLDIEREDS